MTMTSTADPKEIENFSRIAEEWWDERGKFRPLHQMNGTRLGYLRAQLCQAFARSPDDMSALKGLRVLDIGCGGGLLAEPFTRMGASVTGIDASARNIEVAALHARQMGLSIDYRHTQPELLHAAEPDVAYDVVLALEIIEHVADRGAFVRACAALLRPGGVIFFSTLNRTAKSYLLAIIGAEYVLRWLPRGTHDWQKFVTPAELHAELRAALLTAKHTTGFVYHPLKRTWRTDERDVAVNYIVTAKR